MTLLRKVLITGVAAAGLAAPPVALAQPTAVTGSLTLDSVNNRLSVTAHQQADGSALGSAVLKSGLRGVNNWNAPEVIHVGLSCFVALSPTSVIVGGFTQQATEGLGTVFPAYSFVLEDRGPGHADGWTVFAQYPLSSNPCSEAFGPAAETAVAGNIVVR